MAEFKFSCPACGQHIQCDQQWSGQQISCPVCGAGVTVPFLEAPAPAAPGPAPARRLVPKKEPFPVKKVVVWSIGSLAFIVIMFFVLRQADVLQVKFDKQQKEIAAKSSGGELVHMANLYQVLDATDPAKMEQAQMKARARNEKQLAAMMEELKPQPDPTATLPAATVQWSLDDNPQIPSGRVHGNISGEDFAPETVTLQPSPNGNTLAFQQGVGSTADREIFVFLNLGTIDKLPGKSWTVTKDTKGKDAFQIVKRWTDNPKFAPISKTFSHGYAMRVEFGEATRDWQPGRIYLAFPDTNHTVLAGSFALPIPHPEPKFELR